MSESALVVGPDRLGDGNDPILEHADALFATLSADVESVEFEVRYGEGDQDRGGDLSAPDRLRVSRDHSIEVVDV